MTSTVYNVKFAMYTQLFNLVRAFDNLQNMRFYPWIISVLNVPMYI